MCFYDRRGFRFAKGDPFGDSALVSCVDAEKKEEKYVAENKFGTHCIVVFDVCHQRGSGLSTNADKHNTPKKGTKKKSDRY
jgi:hypothetical protein